MTMLTRRTALASAAGLALAPLLGLPARASNQTVKVALDWTPNTNHIGLFVARDKGFYKEAGLDVEILPYTDTSAGTLVANHVADFGVIGSIGLFTQHSAGADLIGTYAIVQHETGRVVFKASRDDIKSPKDLDGKTYGGFGSAWENALLSAMIRHDGGKGEFETVTLGTSAYQALANGSVDFTLEVYTWEGVQAELEGLKQKAFRYADYGVPDEHTALLGSSRKFLDAKPDVAKTFLQATQKGYAFAIDNPDEATDLLISANKDALTNRALIRASLQALIDGHYLRTESDVVGKIDPAKMEAIGTYLFDAKILKDGDGKVLEAKPDMARYFTNEAFGG
ncbi:myristoyl transferase [Rhizobiales bacterium RZME27]|uniref:Thiamine pyrimidine synthase n=1 Tax=Endobacterium cereale TaxID=2663029 RepID=A0A6A8A7K8_9HYPH|nr:ABC transporter substrate-binding protein [Endobacterium cereale]MEB2844897.1 ABC transporter substrate-binding protein [Endobacterium cereale]MQY44811.1 myristoyl transferase [Endobacterium cereale]